MPAGKVNTAYVGVFREKLHKEKERITNELKKAKGKRDRAFIKGKLKEVQSLKKVVKEMEEAAGENEVRTPLFVKKTFTMHSGDIAHYKIECDTLSDEDLDTLAFIVAEKASRFKWDDGTGINKVHGVPRGGVRFAKALEKYAGDPEGVNIIVDDVLTTGASMEEAKKKLGWSDAFGVVIFSRGPKPDWVKAIFEMNWFNTRDEKPLA